MGILRKAFKPMFDRNKWKILRGDTVMIMAGKDRGQVGTVLKVMRDVKFPKVVVEGLNLSKRHIKRTKDNPGGIVSVESPLHYSNVSLVDPVTNAPIKVSWRYLEDGTKVRVTRGRLASQSVVPRPEMLKQRRRPPPVGAGPQDTGAVEFKVVSHTPGDLPSALKSMLEAETVKATAGAASAPPRFIQKKSALYRAPGAFRTFASSAYDFSDQWVTRSNLHPYPTEMWPYNILRPDLLRFYSMTER